ncbi:Putative ABC transporter [Acididesulfobacillus acetoxydans]|uniref:ABC transporter n=1 Tax=Acididesulfobacillus acetoxydans TaxID=1561005 RepID=A0A8S0X561_9FIRM|nr:sugar ABC transporter ATP-binding protein [Acididesulfobacillus acetoxydans]CAA7601390.1 Putative ABC transporter [Acididesulfobacillus acetoxydans]CEJ08821.1 Arabinose import ATP-binding protein AraG [Acididesulfobacillus acetoxydans]
MTLNSSVEFKGITKTFPGVKALDGVSFLARGGEVLALVGENGAGKSTLLKVLNGDYQQDSGLYLIDGAERHFKTPQEAIAAGVSVIYQERQVVPYLNVAENIFMEEIPVMRSGLIDVKQLNARAQKVIDEFKLPIRPTTKVKDLSVAYQQMVEIMKAYRRSPKIIAFDEPTASLSESEISTLFEVIERLKASGIIILYVSHRMKEIFQISDQVVILKDGKYVTQLPTRSITEQEIVKLMVGRELGDIFNGLSRNEEIGEVVLRVSGLTNDYIHDIGFELKAGEILGFAGLVGAGRTETMRAIFGADRVNSGQIFFGGKQKRVEAPEDAIACGLALCPEDRKDQGIVGGRSIADNISLAILKKLSKMGFLDKPKERSLAEDAVRELRIRTPSVDKKVGELSGGNQQKVILARWLAANPKVLLLDEPTKGIDVGSKSEIYQLICDLAKRGIGIILVSSELVEVLGLCDRIIVMSQGRITGELKRKEANEEKVLELAMAGM